MIARGMFATLALGTAVMSGTVMAAPLSAEAPSAQGHAPALNPASDSSEIAIVADVSVPLRASARAASPVQAQLSRGELLEVRSVVPGYLRVYDHRRERPGFVRPAQVRRYRLEPEQLPALAALALFFRDQPGSEELGIAYASIARSVARSIEEHEAARAPRDTGDAHPQASASDPLDDALGQMIDRLARRVSQARAVPDPSLAQALEVAASYGVTLVPLERGDHVVYCSDGAAEMRALARGDGAERARAALLLTQPRCGDPSLSIARQSEWNEWRAQIAARTEPADAPPELGAKLHLRRAEIWSQLSFLRALAMRAASTVPPSDTAAPTQTAAAFASQAAERELALADRGLLAEEDQAFFDEVCVRVAAARWAGSSAPRAFASGPLRVRDAPGAEAAGSLELFADGLCTNDCRPALAVAASALPFPASLRTAPQAHAAAMVVQPLAGWTELWVFHLARDGSGKPPRWVHSVLVPAVTDPESALGAIECAGFTPKGKSMLVVRQAIVEGKLRRQFQELSLDTLRVVAQSDRIEGVRDFARWASADWREHTTALR